ncbi:MAG: DotG/IcmE/VirB10 family protein [Candidatus Competibacteraceae bacterium]|nr:DotG/IcmE/VirB10 family protein [Candidatus Competibacteraceae bacterium]
MTPFVQLLVGGAIAVAVAAAAVGTAHYLARPSVDLKSAGSRVVSEPNAKPSYPGDPQLPDVEDAYTQQERQNRAQADQKVGPGASVPPIDTLRAVPSNLAQAHNPARDNWNRDAEKHVKEREKERQKGIDDKAKSMGKVVGAWGGTHATVEASLKPPEPKQPPAVAKAVHDPMAHLSVDKLYYGLLEVFISSDEPGPVIVTLKDGELDGARLIGSFKRADEKVIIHFDRMTFKKAWYSVDAVALNPENNRLGLATDVDRRTFSRWAALLGSAVLQGAQRAYLNQGTTSSSLWGESSTRNYSDKEILGIAVGEIGTRTRQAANRYFDRPPTVYVDPALQLVGVLFMAPPSQQTKGQQVVADAGIAPPAGGSRAGDELLRAADAALDGSWRPAAQTAAATGAGSGDPAANTRNYTRSSGGPAALFPAPVPDAPAE